MHTVIFFCKKQQQTNTDGGRLARAAACLNSTQENKWRRWHTSLAGLISNWHSMKLNFFCWSTWSQCRGPPDLCFHIYRKWRKLQDIPKSRDARYGKEAQQVAIFSSHKLPFFSWGLLTNCKLTNNRSHVLYMLLYMLFSPQAEALPKGYAFVWMSV